MERRSLSLLQGSDAASFGPHPLQLARKRRLSGSGRAQKALRCFSCKVLVMTQWYFVWIEGLRGPAAQKWSSDALWGQLGRQDVIVRFALTEREAELSLDELARLHPVPAE
jgi:hypothetical protein